MLEKEVVKLTRNGAVRENLATGEHEQLILNDRGKQLHYNDLQRPTLYLDDNKEAIKDTLRLKESQDSAYVEYAKKKQQDFYKKPAADFVQSTAQKPKTVRHKPPELRYKGRLKRKPVTVQGEKEARSIQPRKKSALLVSAGGKAVDAVQASAEKSDNIGTQSVSGAITGARTAETIYKGTKRTVKAAEKTARTAAKASQRAAQAAAKTAKATAAVIKTIVMGLVKILANPYTWLVLLIAGVIILVIIMIASAAAALSSVAASAETTSEQLASYTQHIQDLDNAFKLQVDEEQSKALSGGYAEVNVIGREYVNTNVAQMIEILNYEYDGDLSVTQEKLNRLTEYHSLLYFYDVVYSNRENESGALEPICTITVNAKTPTLILHALGLSAEDIEIIKYRMEEAGIGGGNVIGNGTFIWPLPGYTKITSPFGYRTHPVTGEVSKFHSGIDIGAPTGTSVVAADSGTVIFAGVKGGYGNYVQIDHGNGVITCYGHNSAFLVSAGDSVEQGQAISLVGSTGVSTGPHLHFEVQINGQFVNPEDYFY